MYLDPKNDLAFKKIFGDENKKEILISFLNGILRLDESKKIQTIEMLNPYQIPKLEGLKNTIVDVRCKDIRGISYIVEMQVIKSEAFEKRVQYYLSKEYANQIERGENYPALNPVIFVGILDFAMFENPNYTSTHLVLDVETNQHVLRDFQFTFVELPKFNILERDLKTIEEKWIYFLKCAENLEIIPEVLKEKEIEEAFETLDKYAWTKEELDLYDDISVRQQDERGRISLAFKEGKEEGREEGREEGIVKGREEGIVKGREEGIVKGREEAQIITIKKMLKEGLDINLISKIIGVAISEIERINQ